MVRGLPKYFNVWVARPSRARPAAPSGARGAADASSSAPEHVADDGAPLVADQMKHIADLKVAEALHQPRKQEHADDDHEPDESGENSGTFADPPRSTQASVNRA